MPFPICIRWLVAGFVVSLTAGCLSLPRPSYSKVDRASPAFADAVIREKQLMQAEGKSAAEAEAGAAKRVTQQTIKAQKMQRVGEVAPLVEALAAFDRPCGCWAFTATATTRKPDKTTVQVEHYDPFLPEERVWTLVSRDGEAPTDQTQADFRAGKPLEHKRLNHNFDRLREKDRVKRDALMSDFESGVSDSDEGIRYTVHYDVGLGSGLASIAMKLPAWDETYVVSHATGTVLRYSHEWKDTAKLLGGAVTIDYARDQIEFVLLEPSLPPFVSKITRKYRQRVFGVDSGDVVAEVVYSDYRRVKCYDERFGVKIGPPSMSNFLPQKN